MKKVGFYLVVVCIISGGVWLIAAHILKDDREAVYTIPRHIQYSFTLQNKTNKVIKDAHFWTYAPVKQSPVQFCAKIESTYPYELITDDHGNEILHYSFDAFPPFATKIITISSDLLLSEEPNIFDHNESRDYLLSTKNIESENPDIVKLAHDLKGPDPLQTAHNILDWVSGNIEYTGYAASDRGAAYALKNKKGDCTEYMDLFIALSRANKIPARPVSGYICRENTILKPSSYHDWAEFYYNDTWRIADPQNNIFMQGQSQYIAMRINQDICDNPMLNCSRFRYTGDGLEVIMN